MEELDVQPRAGFMTKIADKLFSRGEDDDYEEEDQPVQRRGHGKALTIKSAPRYNVTIRRQIVSFEDAQAAAAGLRNGEQQILNLTATETSLRQKIIYFMWGVVFATEATWEEVGDHIYLVVPASTEVKHEGASPRSQVLN